MTKLPSISFSDIFGSPPNEGYDKDLCLRAECDMKASSKISKIDEFVTRRFSGQSRSLKKEFHIPDICITSDDGLFAAVSGDSEICPAVRRKIAVEEVYPPAHRKIVVDELTAPAAHRKSCVITQHDGNLFLNNHSRDTRHRHSWDVNFDHPSQKKVIPRVSPLSFRKSSKSNESLDEDESGRPKVKFKTPFSKKLYRATLDPHMQKVECNSGSRRKGSQDGSSGETSPLYPLYVRSPFTKQKHIQGVTLDLDQEKIHLEMLQCIRNDDCKGLRSLLKKRLVDVNMMHGEEGSLIHDAAYKGCTKCIKALLKEGSYVNLCDDLGWTALHAAVLGLNVDAIKVLVENNALPNQVNSDGLSPCHLAVLANDLNVIHELIRAGGDPLSKGPGVTPFQLAIDLKKSVVLDYFLHMSSFLVDR